MAENAWFCPATLGWFPSTKSGNMAIATGDMSVVETSHSARGNSSFWQPKEMIVKVKDRIYHHLFFGNFRIGFCTAPSGGCCTVSLQASGRDQGRGMETAVTNNASDAIRRPSTKWAIDNIVVVANQPGFWFQWVSSSLIYYLLIGDYIKCLYSFIYYLVIGDGQWYGLCNPQYPSSLELLVIPHRKGCF